jgi:hypothetical protein
MSQQNSTPYRLRVGTQAVDDASNALANALNDWLTGFGPTIIYKTCENCKFMSEGNAPAHCSLYNIVPPARVILAGCPSHQDKEEIPF